MSVCVFVLTWSQLCAYQQLSRPPHYTPRPAPPKPTPPLPLFQCRLLLVAVVVGVAATAGAAADDAAAVGGTMLR